MNQSEYLIEEKILQYQSHLDHIDKLVERVDKVGTLDDAEQLYNALMCIREERAVLLTQINNLKFDIHETYLRNGSQKNQLMIIWEAVANKLDRLIGPIDYH